MEIDELLEMSRSMKKRADALLRDQLELADRLKRGIAGLKGVIDAAGEAIKV